MKAFDLHFSWFELVCVHHLLDPSTSISADNRIPSIFLFACKRSKKYSYPQIMLSVLSAVAPPIAPTSTSPNNTIDALLANSQTRAFSPLEDEGTFRTQWNIITTCFFTVVACAWVAIHPNVQCTVGEVNSTKWKRCQYYFGRILRGKIALVFIFLIFPEFIVAWAVSQCWMVNRAHWITGTYSISYESYIKTWAALTPSQLQAGRNGIHGLQ
jgi:hypothetical protein